jgi:polyisoprenoid-binding protein YceI
VSVTVDAANRVRYSVTPADSSVEFEARSTLHTVRGKVQDLTGSIEVTWNDDGTIAPEPPAKMHVDLPVEQMRSGNGMLDREMWKLIDSKRFPRVAGDLRTLTPGPAAGRYAASGDITLAGRSRRYDGEFTVKHDDACITIEGELNVDIRDFGLKPPNLVVIKVDPGVKVRVRLVAARAA